MTSKLLLFIMRVGNQPLIISIGCGSDFLTDISCQVSIMANFTAHHTPPMVLHVLIVIERSSIEGKSLTIDFSIDRLAQQIVAAITPTKHSLVTN